MYFLLCSECNVFAVIFYVAHFVWILDSLRVFYLSHCPLYFNSFVPLAYLHGDCRCHCVFLYLLF